MFRTIAIAAVLGLAASQAEATDRARLYLEFDRGGLYGFGIDYRDYGPRHDRYRYDYDGHRHRHGPPYGRALGYWDRPLREYQRGYRDGWRDGRRYERRFDGRHDGHRDFPRYRYDR